MVRRKRVAVVELPDRQGNKVKDAFDWLAAGGDFPRRTGRATGRSAGMEAAAESTATARSETEQETRRESAPTRLVRLVKVPFPRPAGSSVCQVEIKGHTEVWPVESSKFRKLLARDILQAHG